MADASVVRATIRPGLTTVTSYVSAIEGLSLLHLTEIIQTAVVGPPSKIVGYSGGLSQSVIMATMNSVVSDVAKVPASTLHTAKNEGLHTAMAKAIHGKATTMPPIRHVG